MRSSQLPRVGLSWNRLGPAISDMLRYERKIGHYEQASYSLLSTVVHGTGSRTWREFLLVEGNVATVVGHVLALSQREGMTPTSALDATCDLVEGAWARGGMRTWAVLPIYLRYRADLPSAIRDGVDAMLRGGKTTVPLRVAALAAGMQDLYLAGLPSEVLGHWYREALSGRVTLGQAGELPHQILEAKQQLLSFFAQAEGTEQLDDAMIYGRHRPVFSSGDMPKMVEIAIGMHRCGLKNSLTGPAQAFPRNFRLELEDIEALWRNLPEDEVVRRMERLV